jgi:hypothetical protein
LGLVDAIADTFKVITMFHGQHADSGISINPGSRFDGIEVGHEVHLFCLALMADLGFQHEYNTGFKREGQEQVGHE